MKKKTYINYIHNLYISINNIKYSKLSKRFLIQNIYLKNLTKLLKEKLEKIKHSVSHELFKIALP